MILLGDKHHFTERELSELRSIFPSIDTVHYRHADTQAVIDQIDALLAQSNKSTLVLNTAARIPDTLLTHLVSLESHGIRYLSVESFLEKYLFKCYIPEDQINVDFLEKIRPYTSWQYFLKRTSDYIVSILLGVVSIPAVLYSVYKIKQESPGAILFRQTRVGQNGKPFTCYKFRSMHENSRHDPYTRENDDRIFPWGNFMRKTRIDELPQLINVIRGDMHLLGPRAEWNILVENYEKEIPFYHQRHIVKPGITGWAQVMYPYGANAEDAHQKLMYDLYYIKHWSPWLEIKTIWNTIMVVLGKQGL